MQRADSVEKTLMLGKIEGGRRRGWQGWDGWMASPTPGVYSNSCPLLLSPSIFPSIRVFSTESALHIRWPKYWSFSFSISPSNEYLGLIFFRIDWLDLLAVQGTLSRVFSNTTVQKHQFFSAQPSLWSYSHIHTWLLEKPYLWLDRPLSTR